MSLNENALDDLSGDAEDLQTLSGTDLTGANNIAAVVVPDGTEIVAPIVPVTVVQPMDAASKTLDEIKKSCNSTAELCEIQEQVIAQEGISRHDVAQLGHRFKNIVTRQLSVASFTEARSKTGYQHVKRVMGTTIAVEQINVLSNVQTVLDAPLQDANTAYQQMLVSYLPTLSSQFYDLLTLCNKIKEDIDGTKNAVFPYGEGMFLDLRKTEPSDIDVDKLRKENLIPEDILGCIQALGMVLKNPVLCDFISKVIRGEAHCTIFAAEYHPVFVRDPVTPMDLVTFYRANPENYITDLEKVCQENLKALGKLTAVDVVVSELNSQVGTDSFGVKLAEALPKIQVHFAVLRRCTYLVNALGTLNFASERYLRYLSKL